MATVSLIQMLAAGMATSTGAPVASGKVSFYLPGTLTPVSVYADSAAATPIAPPLTLTAGGTGVAYTKVPTRMIVKDSTSTTTYFDGNVNIGRAEQEMIQSAAINGGTETTLQAWLDAYTTSFGGSAGLWKIKTATSAVERNLIDLLLDSATTSVKSFGAAGDGIADDTAEIQATMDYVASQGGGTVFFPPGTYLVSSALNLPLLTQVTIAGVYRRVTYIKNTNVTGGVFITPAPGFPVAVSVFKNITISHTSSSSGTAVRSNTGSVTFDDAEVLNHTIAVFASSVISRASSFAATLGSGGTAVTATTIKSELSTYGSSTGTALATSSGRLVGDVFSGSIGADVSTGGTLSAAACASTATTGLRTDAASGLVLSGGCDWGTINDRRTGAPVNYVFAGANNVTPLPTQASVIRVEQGTGGVVTTINNIAAIGFGTFTLICTNTSGGASTFTFGGNYVLSAAVTPGAGTRVNLLLAYDPITSKTYEVGRAAMAN